MSVRSRGWATLAIATVGFALALALRDQLDPWRSTAIAATLGGGLSVWALGPRIRSLCEVTARGVLGALALGIVLVVATHAAFRIVVITSPELAASIRALYASVDVASSRITLAILTTLVVIGEELVWRGVTIDLVSAGRSKIRVGALGAIAYVVPQLAGGVPLLILAAIGLGSLFAMQRIVTGRLTDPILTHVVWSVSVFVVFPLA